MRASASSTGEPTEREIAETEPVELIREIFDITEGNYGSHGSTVNSATAGSS